MTLALGTAVDHRPLARTASIVVGGLTTAAFLLLAANLIANGQPSRDLLVILSPDEPWRNGGWLTQWLVILARLLPADWAQQSLLAALSAVAAGVFAGVSHFRMRQNEWPAWQALLLVAAFAGHAMILYVATASVLPMPIFLVAALLVPAMRRLEAVSDAQAIITLGVVLAAMVLASPAMVPLIPPIAIFAALHDRDGRQDLRAFSALLLVMLIPSVVVALGVIGFAAQARMRPDWLVLPYITDFVPTGRAADWTPLVLLPIMAPVMFGVLGHCLIPDRRRQIFSALMVVALPIYVAVGQTWLPWQLPRSAPAVTLLVAFCAWAGSTRVRPHLRPLLIGLILIGTATSWGAHGLWDQPAWRMALLPPWLQLG